MPATHNAQELPSLVVIPAALAVVPPGDAAEKMRASLALMKVSDLKVIARERGFKVRSVAREAVVAELLEPLADRELNCVLLDKSDAVQRAVLALLLLGRGDGEARRLTGSDFQALLRGWGAKAKEVETAVLQLSQRGLLLPAPGQERALDPRWQINAALPALTLPLLPGLEPFSGKLPQLAVTPPDAAISAVLDRLDRLGDELGRERDYKLPSATPNKVGGAPVRILHGWMVVGEQPPRTTPQRVAKGEPRIGSRVLPPHMLLSDDVLAPLIKNSGLSDERHTELYLRVLLTLDFLYRTEPDLVMNLPGYRGFRALPASTRFGLIANMLRGLVPLGELDLLLAYDPQLSLWAGASLQYADPTAMLGDAVRVRHALLALLSWLPSGSWYDLESLLTTLRRLYPQLPITFDALAPQWQDTVWWFQRTPDEPAPGKGYLDRSDARDWRAGIGRMVITLLLGPLSWLGLVEVVDNQGQLLLAGRSADLDAAAGFRLTELGGSLLSARPPELLRLQPPPAGSSMETAVALDPRRPDLIIARGLDLDGRKALADFADPVLQSTSAITYRLSKDSVLRGFDAGVPVARMTALLSSAGGPDVKALTARLHEWWEQYGRLHIYSGVALIELGDDFVGAELTAGTKLADYLLYEFSPRLWLVREEDVDAIVAMFGRAGQAARVVDDGVAGGTL